MRALQLQHLVSAAPRIYCPSECVVCSKCNCRECQVTFLGIGRFCYLMSLCVHMHLVVHLQFSRYVVRMFGGILRAAFVYSISVFTSGRLQLWQVVEDVCLVVAPQNVWHTCGSHQNPGQQLQYSLYEWNIYALQRSFSGSLLFCQVFPCPRRREQMGLSPKSGSAKLNAVRELRRAKSSTWSIEQRSITMGKRREGRLCWVLYKSKHVIILSFNSNDNNLLSSTDCLDLPTSAHIHLHRFSHLFKGPQVISSQVQYLQLWQLVKGTYHGAQLIAGLKNARILLTKTTSQKRLSTKSLWFRCG